MNKIIVSREGSGALSFNPDTLELTEIKCIDCEISSCCIIDEDSEFIYDGVITDIKAGDIIFKMYTYNGKREYIVMGSNELTDVIKARELDMKKRISDENNSIKSFPIMQTPL